jgi:hypothetical protein
MSASSKFKPPDTLGNSPTIVAFVEHIPGESIRLIPHSEHPASEYPSSGVIPCSQVFSPPPPASVPRIPNYILPKLSMYEYARMRAEMASQPELVPAIRNQYQLSEQDDFQEEIAWTETFHHDPRMFRDYLLVFQSFLRNFMRWREVQTNSHQ